MKYLIVLLSALSITAACAGTATYDPKQSVFVAPFEESFRVSMFGSYRHQLSDGINNADDFGAGVSLYKPLGGTALGIEGGYEWRSGDLTDTHTATLAMRVNLLDLGSITIYGLGGGAYSFTGSEDGWGIDAGLGVELPITERVTAFADYRYRWSDLDAIGDTGGVRLGLGWSF